MFERLLFNDCHGELVTAIRSEGKDAMGVAFEALGKRAAEQLLSDPAASAELEGFVAYVDMAKWDAMTKKAAETWSAALGLARPRARA